MSESQNPAWNMAEENMILDARKLDRQVEDIRQEAGRRILSVVPEYKQRNLLMSAFQLLMHLKQEGQFTKSEKKLWADIQSSWMDVDAIRQVSNEMEYLAEEGRLPENWKEDICWQ